jgi:hypothetical protein
MTSPSMICASSLIRTPMARRKAWVSASVLERLREKSSEAATEANGVSAPSDLTMPMASAVLPMAGWPASRTVRSAIFPCRMSWRMSPAARYGATAPGAAPLCPLRHRGPRRKSPAPAPGCGSARQCARSASGRGSPRAASAPPWCPTAPPPLRWIWGFSGR